MPSTRQTRRGGSDPGGTPMGGALATVVRAAIVMMLAVTALPARRAAAAPAPSSPGYEDALISRSLAERGLEPDPRPAGKTIERIEVASHRIVEPGESWPLWLNRLHRTTAGDVVRRELLVAAGDVWDGARIEESERNLRSHLFVSTARIVAARGASDGSVIAVVVTRDLWSLRPVVDLEVVGSTVNHLLLAPSENNLNGRNRFLGLTWEMFPASRTLDLAYADPRLGGRRLAMSLQQAVTWGRPGPREGYATTVSLAKPFYRLEDRWSWDVSFGTQGGIFRQYRSGEIAGVRMSSTGEVLPLSYRYRSASPSARASYSAGRHVKHRITAGLETVNTRYDLPAFRVRPDSASLTEFRRRVLPRPEKAAIVLTSWQAYRPRYTKRVNIETFARTEDLFIGPSVTASARMGVRAAGFTDRFVAPSVTASWGGCAGDDIVLASAGASARREAGAVPGTNWVDRTWTVSVRNISPVIGAFRLHAAARLTRRSRERTETRETLGGEGALRGYPSGYFTGSEIWGANLELRSRPADIRSVQSGIAFFIDAGDAEFPAAGTRFHASAGAGVRFGFPQFNGPVTRIDLAFPWERPEGVPAAQLVVKTGQAF